MTPGARLPCGLQREQAEMATCTRATTAARRDCPKAVHLGWVALPDARARVVRAAHCWAIRQGAVRAAEPQAADAHRVTGAARPKRVLGVQAPRRCARRPRASNSPTEPA